MGKLCRNFLHNYVGNSTCGILFYIRRLSDGLLLPEQKKELKEWQDAQKLAGTHNTGTGSAKQKPKNESKQHKQWIASVVKAAIEKNKVDATVDDTAESDFKNYIWSLMASKQPASKPVTAASVETTVTPTLQSILRKVSPKNGNRG